MEYGEAITPRDLERAVSIARKLLREDFGSVASASVAAVSRAYCCCVTAGEDAAEGRLSDVHRGLIEAVAQRVAADPAWPGRPPARQPVEG